MTCFLSIATNASPSPKTSLQKASHQFLGDLLDTVTNTEIDKEVKEEIYLMLRIWYIAESWTEDLGPLHHGIRQGCMNRVTYGGLKSLGVKACYLKLLFLIVNGSSPKLRKLATKHNKEDARISFEVIKKDKHLDQRLRYLAETYSHGKLESDALGHQDCNPQERHSVKYESFPIQLTPLISNLGT